jgi:hypothetical protein
MSPTDGRAFPVGAPQRDKWEQTGLGQRSREQQVTRLTATLALELMAHLQSGEGWREERTAIGSPATRQSIDEPERTQEPSLIDEIVLPPKRMRRVGSWRPSCLRRRRPGQRAAGV